MEHELFASRATRERDGHLTAGRDVKRHVLLDGQRRHRLAQKALVA